MISQTWCIDTPKQNKFKISCNWRPNKHVLVWGIGWGVPMGIGLRGQPSMDQGGGEGVGCFWGCHVVCCQCIGSARYYGDVKMQ